MAIPVLVMGKSGSGKSASLRNFGPEEVCVINVLGKPFPFRSKLDKVFKTDDYATVMKALAQAANKGAKAIVIDDAGYLITNEFMRGHAAQGQGNAIFGFYNKLADDFWTLIEYIKKLPDDVVIYVMMHEEQNDFGAIKPKTIGKILDDKVSIEGMFTIVLRSEKDGDRHVFRTKTTGLDVTKTPIGMFEAEEIDNDLQMVDQTIRDYYGIKEKKTAKKAEKEATA